MSRRRALVACAASAVLAHSLVHSCAAAPTDEIAHLTDGGTNEQTDAIGLPAVELQEQLSVPSTLPEGMNDSSQVASLDQRTQVQVSAQTENSTGETEQNQQELSSGETNSAGSAPFRRLQPRAVPEHHQGHAFLKNPFKAAGRRRLDGPLTSVVEKQETQEEEWIPHSGAPSRRLQLFDGLSQLAQPFTAMTNFFGGGISGLSARDKDQLETFARRVGTSREKLYKDLIFATMAKHHGMDEFSMKQFVAKIGCENLSAGIIPSNVQLTHQENLVLEAAKRNRFQVDRIISNYEREVGLHAKNLRQELQGGASQQQAIKTKMDSIASEGLFKRRTLSVRRLQGAARLRRLAALLQGPGLFGTASTLLRSIDPASLTTSLNAGLGGLGLHHLHLPNIGALGLGPDGRMPALQAFGDITGLQQALETIFPSPYQASALSGPFRTFQQGVSTATDGAIGAFLSKEGLLPFLSVETAKHLLGSLIGGEAIAPGGASGWDDIGLSPAAAKGLAGIMPFDVFLSKLGGVAQEVDEDVGALKRETKKRIGAQGVELVPAQLRQVEDLLDRLVWGTLQAPVRRLQEIDSTPPNTQHQDHQPQQPAEALQHQHQQSPQPEIQQQQQQQQPQEAEPQQQQPSEAEVQQQQQQQQPGGSPASQEQEESSGPEQSSTGELESESSEHSFDDDDDADIDNLFESLLAGETWGDDAEDQMDSALQRVELLADAITVLLLEYENAVESLQKLLDEQIDAADDIRDEIEDQVKGLKRHVGAQHQQHQQQKAPHKEGATTAAAEVARAYDEAMEGLKVALQDALQQEQQHHAVPLQVQEKLAPLAAKIEAAAEENLVSPSSVQ